MPDAYTVRVTALIDALRALGPAEITEVPEGALDLSDQDTIDHLDLATDLLVSAAFATLGQAVAVEGWDSRNLFRLTVQATCWTQALVHGLGGIVVTDTLTGAVAAAATYQLALAFACRAHVDLNLVAATVLDKANSPVT